ncbi:MAG: InlB B-repeat-containing protein [Chitinispirillaceae bacterium]|nr:InlB B-repeat-containing protein [Chitinispirillaceae bacterium]
MILYSRWTRNKYTVTYDGNGNDAGSAPTETGYNYGDTVTIAGKDDLVRTGYTFTGWNTAKNGGGTAYAVNATFVLGAEDVTLYAQWKNPGGMVLIMAKGKSFMMGSENGNDDERPDHTIEFSHDFWMDTVEVTQGGYCKVMSTAYSNFFCPDWFDADY